MASVINKVFADNVLNWEKGTQMPTPPSNLYLALLTAMPTKNDGTGLVEVAGGSYARQQITPATWAAITTAADNLTEQAATNADLVFASMPACTVVGVALYDALTAGDWTRAIPLTGGSVVVDVGTSFTVASGNLTRKASGA
jgi:hypothetical protein